MNAAQIVAIIGAVLAASCGVTLLVLGFLPLKGSDRLDAVATGLQIGFFVGLALIWAFLWT